MFSIPLHLTCFCSLAIEKYLIAYLNERDIVIGLPRENEMEEIDTGSPTRFVSVVHMYMYIITCTSSQVRDIMIVV